MNNLSKTTIKLMAVIQVFAITLLTSCTTVTGAAVDINQLSVCHATGDSANPYEVVTFTNNSDLVDHLAQNPDDISPVPVNGCPATLAVVSDSKIAICHSTGDEAAPYNEITVSVDGLNGHGTHEGDIIPVPESGCPASPVTSDETFAICHLTGDSASPYEVVTFTSNSELENYRAQNPNDISPVPVNGCPATLAVVSDGKIMICHALIGEAAPYSEIAVSVDGLDGHGTHEGDIIPVPESGCPASPVTSDDKITICHATGSDKNPYNEITISASGLNGHDTHQGDIIPAPAGGCPTTKP